MAIISRPLVIIALCALTLGTRPVLAGTWSGKTEVVDGVTHVRNPATPVEALNTISPEELWRVGGDDDEDIIFGVLTSIATDARGNVYLLDAQLSQVYVHSADGEYLRTIGREGEGPGEFRRTSDMFITPDGNVAVLQRMPGKIILLDTEGEPMGLYPTPTRDDGSPVFFRGGGVAGDDLVLAMREFARKENSVDLTSVLARVNSQGEVVATYHRESRSRDFAKMTFDEKADAQVLWAADRNGRVYTNNDFDAYAINVFGTDGSLEYVIDREYTHRKRSAAEIERNKPRVQIRARNHRIEPETRASETDRDIQSLYARDDGTLWVLPSRGAYSPDGVIATFDVFDEEGHFVQQVAIKGDGSYRDDGLHFVGDRLYVVRGLRSAQDAMYGEGGDSEDEDEEPEPMAIICYDLAGIVKAAR